MSRAGGDKKSQNLSLTDGICMAHAFIDGNKRTALIACVTFLELNSFTLKNAHGI